jgi:hypothetical protein
MSMDNLDPIETKLKGDGWAGDLAEAKRRGGPTIGLRKSRKAFWIRVGAWATSCVLVAAISVGLTYYFTNHRNDKSGSGATDDGLTYARSLGLHCYPSAVDHVETNTTVYADLYYVISSFDVGLVAVKLYRDLAKYLSIYDASGTETMGMGASDFGCFGTIYSTSYTYSAVVTLNDDTKVTIPSKELNLLPYRNFLLSE